MENVGDATVSKVGGKGFVNHVFNFDNDTKVELMNLGQYALMVLLPLAFANNFIDTLVPKVNESTGNASFYADATH